MSINSEDTGGAITRKQSILKVTISLISNKFIHS